MPRPLLIILATVTLDAIGIGLIMPILPSLLREVAHAGDITLAYGGLIALYAAMQFLCAPVLGVLSDRYGRRPVLIGSLAGAAIDYLFMAFAPELWMLFLGRAIAGATAANMAVATAYITDITPEEERARRFGYFHAMFGIGFIIGPALGGVLGDAWVRAPFLLAAALNGLNALVAVLVLPESRPSDRGLRFEAKALNPFLPLVWALRFRALVPLLAINMILYFVGQVYGSVWVLYGADRYGWDMTMIGLSLAAFGLCHAAAQIFLTGPIVARLRERRSMLLGAGFEITGIVAIAFASQGWLLFALAPAFALGGIGFPAFQALITAKVDAAHQGQLQGVLASLGSLTAVAGPLFFTGIYMLTRDAFFGTVWLAAAAVYALALPLMLGIRDRAPAAHPA
ncbi:Tet(A)/Tet(B)/Tet(C) family tetracycline efflux MFS transporter [Paracoccus sp. S-4012]|uniref:Tet(A)/Tet(B)/Tet(C) family tetracycline efflux MFS transporter n=1 Tax=Paracoccus sp. S-4012 TaxID=2665648 RepID=UPI0012AFF356|nr:Tet(A)/Tet(B)/Tet(C) family tetracycline efflux MFS transporter [Paracoccus sp. S-4012]MRX49138.1 Tet(A)/Tet(B)/Tet(C) family tetracycline efflux MFS transporter [Paracoccus sp. S-4012]